MENHFFSPSWVENRLTESFGIHYFYEALRNYVRNQFEGLSADQKNAVYGHVYTLARGQPGAETEDFSDPRWGELHALENIPRLIDAMAAALH